MNPNTLTYMRTVVAGLTQTEIADIAGISRSSVSRAERGDAANVAHVDACLRIAAADDTAWRILRAELLETTVFDDDGRQTDLIAFLDDDS